MKMDHNQPEIKMPAIFGSNEPLTMSSREIADLCEKQHQHVKRDIETMCAGLEINPSSFGRLYKDARNRDQTEFHLPKDLTLTLVAGYNVSCASVSSTAGWNWKGRATRRCSPGRS